ncbi:hypothetical protein FQN57_001477 [Myotisia sp. PD_48]|nr:hypothetical protein FQN57_001477 [Myotisia sp. PD_48]
MYLFALILMAFIGLAQAQGLHSPSSKFPPGCKSPSPEHSEVRALRHVSDSLGQPQFLCVTVGPACKTEFDCPMPSAAQCPKDRYYDKEREKKCWRDVIQLLATKPKRISEALWKAYTEERAKECKKLREGKLLYEPGYAKCIDGFCRIGNVDGEGKCDCLQGCFFKSTRGRDQNCVEGKCVQAKCAPCGEAPNNRACCSPGVVGQDGKCFCATGIGDHCRLASKHKLCDAGPFNDMCCGKGTKNDGRCCKPGTCDSQCLHSPK